MKLVKHFRIGDDTEVFLYNDRTIELVQQYEYDHRTDVLNLTFDELYELYVVTKTEDTGE